MSSSSASATSSSSSSSASSSSSSSPLLSTIAKLNPSLRDGHDCIALVFHLQMISAGWKLVGTQEKALEEKEYKDLQTLPKDWNSSDDAYCMVYAFMSSSSTTSSSSSSTSSSSSSSSAPPAAVLCKLLRMERQLLINGARKNDSNTVISEIGVDDFVDEKTVKEGDYSKMFKNLKSLASTLDSSFISKVTPQPKKEDTTRTTASSTKSPLKIEKKDDKDKTKRDIETEERRRGDFDDDLYPLGDRNPLLISRGGGGSSLLGPNHPIFGGRGGRGMRPRFDPFGPFPDAGEPDNDFDPLGRDGNPFGGGGGGLI
eukprot:TRINITY_DN3280_c0_g1_i1.p1 TRINITY_DN3280_c0_g1~~TRINITY_DN3280_c0_g1_i1.p1  ORF type:complete len:341 (-),score=127.75 TRINITY_DN3280_c0_g1_i1:311-1252(-)